MLGLRIILTLMAIACSAGVAWSDVTVKVTGSGATRTAALEDATRQAVQLAMEQLVVTDRKIVNDEIVRDETISTLNGFIKKRKILATRKSAGEVEIDALITVSERQVTNYIGDISPGNKDRDGTAIDGTTLGSELERQRGAADSSRALINRLLRGFPLNALDVKIESARISGDDRNILEVTTRLRWKSDFLKAFSQSVRSVAIKEARASRGGYYDNFNPDQIVNSWDRDPPEWWVSGPLKWNQMQEGFHICFVQRDPSLQNQARCYLLRDRPNMDNFPLSGRPGLRVSFKALNAAGAPVTCLNPTREYVPTIPIASFGARDPLRPDGIMIGEDSKTMLWKVDIRGVDLSDVEQLVPYPGLTTYNGYLSYMDDGGSVIYDVSTQQLSQPCE
jgi:hypothetical protein